MGKKRVSILGSENETDIKAKKARQLEQKKKRQGLPASRQGQRVVDTTAESLAELTVIEKKLAESVTLPSETSAKEGKKTHVRSKSYAAAKSQINVEKTYALPEGLTLLRRVSLSKFDPTVELHLTLKDKGFNKEIELPHSTGKTRRIATADSATLAKIEKGQIDFDVLLASPAQMGQLVKLAKVLGPKGLMPNPKSGTIVANPEEAAKKMAGINSLLLKTEKDTPVIHTIVGKLSYPDANLAANISAVLSAIPRIKKTVLKSTMSPAIKIQL